MIKSIELENFQLHKNTIINFDEGINALIGMSSAGKSTVLRALRWVRENRPSGNSIVSFSNRDKKGGPVNDTSVTITMDDGSVIKRIKNKSLNGYVVNGEELSAIGRDVPEQVTRLLGLQDINVHSQFEPHFLISQSNGEVARYLNNLINLNVIDDILAKAESDKRSNNRNIKEYEEGIKNAKEKIESLSWVPRAEELIREINEVEEEYKDVGAKRTLIDTIVMKAKAHDDSIKRYYDVVMKAEPIIKEIDTYVPEITKLKDTINFLTNQVDRSVRYTEVLIEKELIEEAEEIIEDIDILMKKNDKVKDTIFSLSTAISSYPSRKSTIEQLSREIKELEAMLPEVCPVCGGKI